MTKIIVVYNSYLTQLLGLDGLVLYPFILISTRMKDTLPSTLKHEMTHVNQINRDGWCRFYCQYCIYTCRDCYANNKYEREAYAAENMALTPAELEILNLPPTFPKTDKEMNLINTNK